MTVLEEMTAAVEAITQNQWSIRQGQVVPDPEDLRLGNDAVEFDRATVLYADLKGSTKMVDAEHAPRGYPVQARDRAAESGQKKSTNLVAPPAKTQSCRRVQIYLAQKYRFSCPVTRGVCRTENARPLTH